MQGMDAALQQELQGNYEIKIASHADLTRDNDTKTEQVRNPKTSL